MCVLFLGCTVDAVCGRWKYETECASQNSLAQTARLAISALLFPKQDFSTDMSDRLPRGWGWTAKLPGSPGVKGFLASAIVITVVCAPKYFSGRTKQGHGLLDNEMPSDVRAAKDAARRRHLEEEASKL